MKAEVLYLLDEYEEKIESSVTGKKKKWYVGKIGKVINRLRGKTSNDRLYDLQFEDGQKWCFEREQIEFVGD